MAADPFYNRSGTVLSTNASTGCYTAPSGVSSVLVNAVYLSNTTGSAVIVTLNWFDSTASVTHSIITGATIPPNQTLQPIVGALPLHPGDSIKVAAGTANAVDVTVCAAEIT